MIHIGYPYAASGGEEDLEAQAAAWLAQREEGFSSEEAEAFARWRAADPRHEQAVRQLEEACKTMERLRDYRPEAKAHPDCDLLAPTIRKRTRRPSYRPAGAWLWSAGFACCLALFLWKGFPNWGAEGANDAQRVLRWSTQAAGYQRCRLPDGSQVELNAETSIEYSGTTQARTVRLLRGEAFFTVAKDAARPFVVDTGVVEVKAVGTAFNVQCHESGIAVLVTEGRVRIEPTIAKDKTRSEQRSERASSDPSETSELSAGQQAVVSLAAPRKPQVTAVDTSAIRKTLSWQEPRLHFHDTPLAEAVRRFNRVNDVQLELADTALEHVLVAGSFRPGNVDAFVALLEENGVVAVDRSKAGRVRLKAAQ